MTWHRNFLHNIRVYDSDGSPDRKAPISSTSIEAMRNSSSRQVRLAHDYSLAKGGTALPVRLHAHPAPYILSS